MSNATPVNEARNLDEPACWDLLRSTEVGRLAVSGSAFPAIYPMNFVVDHGTIVLRTGPGSKLDAIRQNPAVSFEVDADATGQAWSVVVTGLAEFIDAFELIDSPNLAVYPWHAGPKSCFIRIVPGQVSGRRFSKMDRGDWPELLDSHAHVKEDDMTSRITENRRQ